MCVGAQGLRIPRFWGLQCVQTRVPQTCPGDAMDPRGCGTQGRTWATWICSEGRWEPRNPKRLCGALYGDSWLGGELGTKTPKGKNSDAHPNNPRRKEWEAFTRFSASAISWTASRSFPALSMSPAAAKASATDLQCSRDDLTLPLAGAGTQARCVGTVGICSPRLHHSGSCVRGHNYNSQKAAGQGRAGACLEDPEFPGLREEGEGAWPSGGVLGQGGLQGFKECRIRKLPAASKGDNLKHAASEIIDHD